MPNMMSIGSLFSGIALDRPRVPEPSRRQVLALALLAEGAGAIGGDAGHRIVIAMSAMRPDDLPASTDIN